MKIYVSRNFQALVSLLSISFGLIECLRIGSLKDDVIERFYYTVSKKSSHKKESIVEIEYLVIGRKVPWMEAKALCPSYDDDFSNDPDINPENVIELDNTIQGAGTDGNTTLATFRNDEERNWLARMLSESNYRYEGLWIGASRKNKSDGWRWISEQRMKSSLLLDTMVYDKYPKWYTVSEEIANEQNCLLFNRIGHDVPVLIPEKCNLPRTFICMRDAKRRSTERISEAASITIDGYRYTLYRVTDNTNDCRKTADVKRLNGGGVNWRDAMVECRKRGQHLAMVFTNEAATAIADLMLKNRPSMENVWLGGWSSEGTDWTWVSSGSTLATTKSKITDYPPWLEGHPVKLAKSDYYYQRRSRCLILDRHLCPDQVAPVFLDLDCEKERPFVCQDGLNTVNPEARINARRSMIDKDVYEFSEDKMTYKDGEDYCASRNGQIASILDSKILSTCLDKMSELSINHIWVNGRTRKFQNEYRWVDDNDQPLSPQGIGAGTSWCFGEENGFLPKAESKSCLNLDSEARGFPLFYGVPCNSSQIVLCRLRYDGKQYHAQHYDDDVVEAHVDDVDTRTIDGYNIKKNTRNVTEVPITTATTLTSEDIATSKPVEIATRIVEPIAKRKGTARSATKSAVRSVDNATRSAEPIAKPKKTADSTTQSATDPVEIATRLLEPALKPNATSESTESIAPVEIATRLSEPTSNPNATSDSSESLAIGPDDIATRSLEPTSKPNATSDSSESLAIGPDDIATRSFEPISKPNTTSNATSNATEPLVLSPADIATRNLEPVAKPISTADSVPTTTIQPVDIASRILDQFATTISPVIDVQPSATTTIKPVDVAARSLEPNTTASPATTVGPDNVAARTYDPVSTTTNSTTVDIPTTTMSPMTTEAKTKVGERRRKREQLTNMRRMLRVNSKSS